jgi:hypothetical protein
MRPLVVHTALLAEDALATELGLLLGQNVFTGMRVCRAHMAAYLHRQLNDITPP